MAMRVKAGLRSRFGGLRRPRSQQSALEKGLWVDPRAAKVTLQAWAAEWERTVVHLRASTQRIYAANLRNHILPELGVVELGKLTPSMLWTWLSGLTTKSGGHGKRWHPAPSPRRTARSTELLAAAVDDELLGWNRAVSGRHAWSRADAVPVA